MPPRKPTNNLIGATELGQMFGVTRQTIARWWQEGHIQRDSKTAKYYRAEAIEAIEQLRGQPAHNQSSATTERGTNWKEEKLKYDALKAKAEYQITIGELIDKQSAESLFAEIAISLKDALQNLPASAARMVVTLEDEDAIEKYLTKEIQSIIAETVRKIDALGTD